MSQFLKEITKRKKIPFKELCYYKSKEIIDLVEKNKIIDTKLRFTGFIMYYTMNKDLHYYYGKEAVNFMTPYLKEKIDKDAKSISGIVVSKGKIVKGKAKVILTPRNIENMDDGDILIAPMTSPDYIIAMRKASAIITDSGGMTSHAAIVSRELKKPCIVGTKVASKWLKDNDIIEVDTDKGVVRKL